jgi:dTDP-4-amino-4,6-dideoxygalactose transaminase
LWTISDGSNKCNCTKHNLLVVEDAAQSHGASQSKNNESKSKRSVPFILEKIWGTGDGAIVTNDSELAK